MNSNSVDLIYLDPPFNSKTNYAAPIGSKAAGAEFKDTWSLDDIDDEWIKSLAENHPRLYRVLLAAMTDSDKAYLAYMTPRLIEMKRILKDTGSIYLHCDPTMSHYLKLLMDAIFGRENFRNEIVWRIGWVSGYKSQKRGWIRNHDTLLYYVMSNEARNRFNKEYIPYPADYVRRDGKPPSGKGFPIEDTWNCHNGDVLDSIMIKSFSTEKTGYPTQKPLALLDRIIDASSNEGDIVFDPFCGCATTLVAAEFRPQRRRWVGIDISPKAVELVIGRIEEGQGMYKDIIHRKDLPQRTDLGKLPSPRSWLDHLYGKQGGNCNGCRHHQPIKENFDVDHIIPKSKGGTDHLDNLQLLCGNCNNIKGSRSMEYLNIARKRTKNILEIA